MIEQLLLAAVSLAVGVGIGSPIGAYVGAKVIKRDLKKEVSGYIVNELPHLLESEEFKQKGRELARVFIRELITIGLEELGIKEKVKDNE